MFKTLLILIISLLPALWSLWVIRKIQLQIRHPTRYFRQYVPAVEVDSIHNFTPSDRYAGQSQRYYLEGVGYLIGDISCKFNARSGYIRCAVNPSGPCEDCRYYESN